jgi:hypothetical protein
LVANVVVRQHPGREAKERGAAELPSSLSPQFKPSRGTSGVFVIGGATERHPPYLRERRLDLETSPWSSELSV